MHLLSSRIKLLSILLQGDESNTSCFIHALALQLHTFENSSVKTIVLNVSAT